MLTVITNGNVNNKLKVQKAQAAKNFPHTKAEEDMGRVIICKMVPLLNSSAQRRMAIPGMKSNKIHGKKLNIGCKEALPWVKIPPKYKAKELFRSKKHIKYT